MEAQRVGRRPLALPLLAALALALSNFMHAALAPGEPAPVPAPASLADALFRRGGRRFLRKRMQESRRSFDDDERRRPRRRVARRRGGVRRGGPGRRS
mmetsp:Transcript_102408/g.285377  ORF Transcript_102408/g.285377 Transcript_102408/m.285377 type:complete len:98 (-) Transcript_102408:207-500(-)